MSKMSKRSEVRSQILDFGFWILDLKSQISNLKSQIFLLLFTAYCLLFTMPAIAAESAIKLYPTPSERSLPIAISVDAKGQIWFAEFAENKIGRLDVKKGDIAEYTIPTPLSQPIGIAADANGRIWFIEAQANKL